MSTLKIAFGRLRRATALELHRSRASYHPQLATQAVNHALTHEVQHEGAEKEQRAEGEEHVVVSASDDHFARALGRWSR